MTERLFLRREAYFAIVMDREQQGPVMIGSPAGGMDIEVVAHKTPHLIFKVVATLAPCLVAEQSVVHSGGSRLTARASRRSGARARHPRGPGGWRARVAELQLERLARSMGFSPKGLEAAMHNMRQLYQLFLQRDCTLVRGQWRGLSVM